MMEAERLEEAICRRALEMLGRRAMSRRELIDKLVGKGEEESAAVAVADWLVEKRFLNDGDYAEQIVRHYAGKGYGRQRLTEELWRRGIGKDLWDAALQEMPEGDEALDRFIHLKLRGVEPDRAEEKRVADALRRRGYDWDAISEALRRYKDAL